MITTEVSALVLIEGQRENPATGMLQIASAGMHGPLHLREEGCEEIALCGIPPGLFPHSDYEMKQIQLAPGDSVVFLSDELVDAMNSRVKFWGSREQWVCCADAGKNLRMKCCKGYLQAWKRIHKDKRNRMIARRRLCAICSKFFVDQNYRAGKMSHSAVSATNRNRRKLIGVMGRGSCS